MESQEGVVRSDIDKVQDLVEDNTSLRQQAATLVMQRDEAREGWTNAMRETGHWVDEHVKWRTRAQVAEQEIATLKAFLGDASPKTMALYEVHMAEFDGLRQQIATLTEATEKAARVIRVVQEYAVGYEDPPPDFRELVADAAAALEAVREELYDNQQTRGTAS